jgi:hypothetical protein
MKHIVGSSLMPFSACGTRNGITLVNAGKIEINGYSERLMDVSVSRKVVANVFSNKSFDKI